MNILAVLVAALVASGIGALWYSPLLFANVWMREAGVSQEDVESGKKKMPFYILINVIAAAVLAWVLAHFAVVWGSLTVGSALELAFWVWIGFMVPMHINSVLWEGKSLKYFAINAGYWLVSVIAISVIVTLWI